MRHQFHSRKPPPDVGNDKSSGEGWGDRKHLAQLDDSVAQGLQGEGNVVRHIVVQQEFHCVAAAICRATSTSISPR